jgi:hypothetical protein
MSRRGRCDRANQDVDSFESFVSSMAMSLNSLDSKISPHSRHSTNSSSSSRATICTRGCLHFAFSENWDGGVGVINPGVGFPVRTVSRISPEFGGILDRLIWLSSPSLDLFVDGVRSKLDLAGFAKNTGPGIDGANAVQTSLLAVQRFFSTIACKGLHLSRLPPKIEMSD